MPESRMDFNAVHNYILSIKAEDGGASSHKREGRHQFLRIIDILFLSPLQV